ncbi:hypothetical protein B0H14DRAFT_3448655 [Mycena olivaceomarginata]|nr:hypothetical protein B0H14DRAFT_3448655 [Mycena olivaceomarginata]
MSSILLLALLVLWIPHPGGAQDQHGNPNSVPVIPDPVVIPVIPLLFPFPRNNNGNNDGIGNTGNDNGNNDGIGNTGNDNGNNDGIGNSGNGNGNNNGIGNTGNGNGNNNGIGNTGSGNGNNNGIGNTGNGNGNNNGIGNTGSGNGNNNGIGNGNNNVIGNNGNRNISRIPPGTVAGIAVAVVILLKSSMIQKDHATATISPFMLPGITQAHSLTNQNDALGVDADLRNSNESTIARQRLETHLRAASERMVILEGQERFSEEDTAGGSVVR